MPERSEDEVASTGDHGSKCKLKQIEGVGSLQRVIIKKQASGVCGWPGNANCCNILRLHPESVSMAAIDGCCQLECIWEGMTYVLGYPTSVVEGVGDEFISVREILIS